MTHRAKEKTTKKEIGDLVKRIEDLERRSEQINESLRGLFGTEPQILNLHFVLDSFRKAQELSWKLSARASIFEEFVVETGQKEAFISWQEKKSEKEQKDKEEK